MTGYLWLSPSTEADQDGLWKPSSTPRYGDNGSDICVYRDSEGEPARVTLVSNTPEHGSGFKDLQLVDVVKDLECMVARGALQKAGFAFCKEREIAPDFNSLSAYMKDRDKKNTGRLRRCMAVHKPLRLKAG